jgi:hypothetical protein
MANIVERQQFSPLNEPQTISGSSSLIQSSRKPVTSSSVREFPYECALRFFRGFKSWLETEGVNFDSSRDDLSVLSYKSEKARGRLIGMEEFQLYLLTSDLYDEMERRKSPGKNIGGLPPKSEFTQQRNEVRKKFADYSPERFRVFVHEVMIELSSRFPNLAVASSPPSFTKRIGTAPIETLVNSPPSFSPHDYSKKFGARDNESLSNALGRTAITSKKPPLTQQQLPTYSDEGLDLYLKQQQHSFSPSNSEGQSTSASESAKDRKIKELSQRVEELSLALHQLEEKHSKELNEKTKLLYLLYNELVQQRDLALHEVEQAETKREKIHKWDELFSIIERK